MKAISGYSLGAAIAIIPVADRLRRKNQGPRKKNYRGHIAVTGFRAGGKNRRR